MADDNRYRPAALRGLRERDEKVKRGALATAVGDARTTDAQLAAAREALATAIAARDAEPTAARRVLAERWIARRRRELRDALDASERAQGELDAARRSLAVARAQKELVERHFEKWREARRKLAERRED